MNAVVNLKQKLGLFGDHWAPRVVAALNDYHIKVVKIQGEFVPHSHPETDELFLVLQGSMRLEFSDGVITLGEGEMFVVPRGVQHKPIAEEECQILLIEPAGTVNTGDAKNKQPAANNVWI